jgi:hypothetical protein
MKRRRSNPLPVAAAALLTLLLASSGAAQVPAGCAPALAPRAGGPQVADSGFRPPVGRAWPAGREPLVLLDEAHHNFHTVAGRYAPFAGLLTRAGYRVEGLRAPLSAAALAAARVLVIANPLAERNVTAGWSLPTPSAFAPAEAAALSRWVADGGSLLLIADHMPFPGAVESLAAAFGVVFANGFVTDARCAADELVFRQTDSSLADHPVTRGRSREERIDSVRTFTGSAFRLLGDGTVLLRLPRGTQVLLPVTAWRFSDSTPRMAAEGLAQGALLRHGRGRVAVFGEAAMFSAQVSGPARRPMGMNAPGAAQNPQFLLNLMHWLTGLLEPE